MKTMQDRLLMLLEKEKLSQDDLADKIGASQAAISKIVLGETKRSRLMPKIAEALGVTEQWLMFGDAGESNAEVLPVAIQEWDNKTQLPDDMVEVPYFSDMSLSAGYGAMNNGLPYIGEKLWYSKGFIRRKGACLDKVFCIRVHGDSMDPEFKDGGVVMIDMLGKEIIDGKPYALTYQDSDYIKFLRRLPNNKVRVISANPEYENFDVGIEELVIIGRVIEYSKEW